MTWASPGPGLEPKGHWHYDLGQPWAWLGAKGPLTLWPGPALGLAWSQRATDTVTWASPGPGLKPKGPWCYDLGQSWAWLGAKGPLTLWPGPARLEAKGPLTLWYAPSRWWVSRLGAKCHWHYDLGQPWAWLGAKGPLTLWPGPVLGLAWSQRATDTMTWASSARSKWATNTMICTQPGLMPKGHWHYVICAWHGLKPKDHWLGPAWPEL